MFREDFRIPFPLGEGSVNTNFGGRKMNKTKTLQGCFENIIELSSQIITLGYLINSSEDIMEITSKEFVNIKKDLFNISYGILKSSNEVKTVVDLDKEIDDITNKFILAPLIKYSSYNSIETLLCISIRELSFYVENQILEVPLKDAFKVSVEKYLKKLSYYIFLVSKYISFKRMGS